MTEIRRPGGKVSFHDGGCGQVVSVEARRRANWSIVFGGVQTQHFCPACERQERGEPFPHNIWPLLARQLEAADCPDEAALVWELINVFSGEDG